LYRPIVGRIIINLSKIDGGEDNLNVMLHEIMHVMGFSSNLYPFFYDRRKGFRLHEAYREGKIILPKVVKAASNYFGCS
jgi:hypothetical protein